MFHVKHVKMTALSMDGSIAGELRLLASSLLEHDIILSENQQYCLYRYVEKIVTWNRRINLVSRNDEHHIVERHIRESMAIPHVVTISAGATLLDLGSGAGLPGIPIKIVRPDLRIVLVESRRKRALFLREVVQFLNLSQMEIIQERVERLNPGSVHCDIIVARGVAGLRTLWEWSRPLLNEEGALVALKGGEVEAEITSLHAVDPSLRVVRIPLSDVFARPAKGRSIITVQHGEQN